MELWPVLVNAVGQAGGGGDILSGGAAGVAKTDKKIL